MYNLFRNNSNQNIGQNSSTSLVRPGLLPRKNSSGINAILEGMDDGDRAFGQARPSYDHPLLPGERPFPTTPSHTRFTTSSSNLQQLNQPFNQGITNPCQGKNCQVTIQTRTTYHTVQPPPLKHELPTQPTEVNQGYFLPGRVQEYSHVLPNPMSSRANLNNAEQVQYYVRPEDSRVMFRDSYDPRPKQSYQTLQQNTHFAPTPVQRPVQEVASNIYYSSWAAPQTQTSYGENQGHFVSNQNQHQGAQNHHMQPQPQSQTNSWNMHPANSVVQFQQYAQQQPQFSPAPVYQNPNLQHQAPEYQPPRQSPVVSGSAYDHSYNPYRRRAAAHYQPAVIPTGPIFGDGPGYRPNRVIRWCPARPAEKENTENDKETIPDQNGNVETETETETSKAVSSEGKISVETSNEHCGDVNPSISHEVVQQESKSAASIASASASSRGSLRSEEGIKSQTSFMSSLMHTALNSTTLLETEQHIEKPEAVQESAVVELRETSGLLPANIIVSIGNAFASAAATSVSLFANIVPSESKECTVEEMDACEDDVPVCMMRAVGVPQQVRYSIYDEVCGELEAIQDLGSGTCEAFSTMLKWVYAGNREKLADFVRKVCLIHTEVELDSDVWGHVKRNKSEAVFNVIEEIVSAEEIATVEEIASTETTVVAKMEEQPNNPISDKKPPLPSPRRSKSVSFAVSDADGRNIAIFSTSTGSMKECKSRGCQMIIGHYNEPKFTVSCPVIEKASDVPVEPLTPELAYQPAKTDSETVSQSGSNQGATELQKEEEKTQFNVEIEHKRSNKSTDKVVPPEKKKPIIIPSRPNLSSTTFFQPIDWDNNFITQRDSFDTETGNKATAARNLTRSNSVHAKGQRNPRSSNGSESSNSKIDDPTGFGINLGSKKSLCSFTQPDSSQDDLMDFRDDNNNERIA